MKISTIVGARPQFIKAAVVSRALIEHRAGLIESIIHTGQHFDANMSDVFFEELDIPRPQHNLGVGGGTHGENTGRMLEQIEGVLRKDRPDWVLVYGDTDSTLAGALAAVKLHIPVAHVEAGLRSFNRRMPEEINRVLTDHIASLLFTPTELADTNLSREGIAGTSVLRVGDVMYDAALYYGAKAEKASNALVRLGLVSKSYVLATVHRQENTDSRDHLQDIVNSFTACARTIVWPMHPRTRKRLADFGITVPDSIQITDPLGYLDMVLLEKHASAIATDSGGVQKEAYFHGVPCVTLREETEWMELIDAGWNVLAPPLSGKLVETLTKAAPPATCQAGIYGDGHAARHIAGHLARSLGPTTSDQ